MLFDLLVKQRLRDGGIVHLAVPVPAEADHIYHHIAGKFVAIIHRHAGHFDQRLWVLGIDVKYRDGQPLRQIRRKARGMQLLRRGGKTNEIVGNDVHRSADIEAAQPAQVQRLRPDALPGECRIAVNHHRQELRRAALTHADLLGAGSSQHHRIHRFQVAGI